MDGVLIEVSLREYRPGDADLVFEWMRDPESVHLAAFTAADPDDRTAFDAWLARNLANDTAVNRIVEVDGVAVGTISGFVVEGDHELSYWVAREHWGRGIATTAVRAFLGVYPIRPLFARTAAHNAGSARALERNGFVPVGEDRGYAPGVGEEVAEIIHRLD